MFKGKKGPSGGKKSQGGRRPQNGKKPHNAGGKSQRDKKPRKDIKPRTESKPSQIKEAVHHIKKPLRVKKSVKEQLMEMDKKQRREFLRHLRETNKPQFKNAQQAKAIWEKLRR